jgi:hypothetical protein
VRDSGARADVGVSGHCRRRQFCVHEAKVGGPEARDLVKEEMVRVAEGLVSGAHAQN